MRIEHLYRYPVKGLTAEALERAEVAEGGPIAWDRAFALAQGDAPFDPDNPAWLHKTNFMCLMRNARAAALRSSFDPRTGVLTILAPGGAAIAENVLTEAGRARAGAFLTDYLGEEARGTPRFHHIPGHVFGDQRSPVVSLINLASLRAYEQAQGERRDRMRFRANIYFSGVAPWAEFDWIGREIQIGSARVRVTKRTVRCPATQVNPDTAERDANPMEELRSLYGHSDLGIHAAVVEGGHFSVGDALEVLPD
jgi:uncharacterized protein YcbX